MKKLQSDLQLHEQSCGRDLPKERADAPKVLSDVYERGTRGKKAQAEGQSCGRSMVEMLGVLAIIGVLSVGAIAGYSKAMMKYKINKTVDQISNIVANIRTTFSSQKTYRNLTTGTAMKLGLISGNTTTEPDNNLFGGTISVYSNEARKTENLTNSFVIYYSSLPAEACVALATADWGSDQDGLIGVAAGKNLSIMANLTSTYIDDTSGVTVPTDTFPGSVASPYSTVNPTPMSVTYAVLACSGSGSTNSFALKYM